MDALLSSDSFIPPSIANIQQDNIIILQFSVTVIDDVLDSMKSNLTDF